MTPKKEFVLDGSVTMAWYFADESNPYADSVLSDLESARALVPSLWTLEVANTVLVGERRKRSTEAQAAAWLGILETLSIEVDGETTSHAWSSTLALARSQNLSAYDAAYLELAMRRGLPLATLDAKQKNAALAVGVAIYL
jgi:predicted nucleic acid-binding protein